MAITRIVLDNQIYNFESDTFKINQNSKMEKYKFKQVYDYSNYIHINKVFVNTITPENMDSIDRMKQDYCMNNIELIVQKTGCNNSKINKFCSLTPFQIIDKSIGFLLFKCKNTLSYTEIEYLRNAISKIEKMAKEELKKVDIIKYDNIKKIYLQIENQSRIYTCCTWGVDKIFMDHKGKLFNCEKCMELDIVKKGSLGMRFIVDENEKCFCCGVKYLCGGLCEAIENKEILCDTISRLLKLIIYKYIIDTMS